MAEEQKKDPTLLIIVVGILSLIGGGVGWLVWDTNRLNEQISEESCVKFCKEEGIMCKKWRDNGKAKTRRLDCDGKFDEFWGNK